MAEMTQAEAVAQQRALAAQTDTAASLKEAEVIAVTEKAAVEMYPDV